MTLIKAGAKVTALNTLKETALHSACRSGSVDCAQLMIDQGLDVNAPNINFETPIHLMAHDFEKMRTIMEHSKWKRMPRRSKRSRSFDLEEAKQGGDHIHAPRRQSENRIRVRAKARGIFLV